MSLKAKALELCDGLWNQDNNTFPLKSSSEFSGKDVFHKNMICNSGRKCIESSVWVLREKLHSFQSLNDLNLLKSKNLTDIYIKKAPYHYPRAPNGKFWAQELTFSISLRPAKTSPAKLHKCVYYTVPQLNCDFSLKVLPRSTSW